MEVTVSLSLDTDNPIEQAIIDTIRSIPKPARHVSLVTALTLGFAFSSRNSFPSPSSISSNLPEPCSDLPDLPTCPEQDLDESSLPDNPAPQGIHDYLQSFQC